VARFGSDGREAEVPFGVRSNNPGARTRIPVQMPFTTHQAYIADGGKNLDDGNSRSHVPAAKVSFARPLTQTIYDVSAPWQPVFVR
jgi:hypothetical protein